MKWVLPSNREVNVNIFNYSIEWDKPAPSKGAQHVKDFFFRNCKYDVWVEEFKIPSTRLRVDFLNFTKRFAIEFDGKQHNEFVPHFHGSRFGWLKSIKRDDTKEKALEKNNIQLVRIVDADLPLTKDFLKEVHNIEI